MAWTVQATALYACGMRASLSTHTSAWSSVNRFFAARTPSPRLEPCGVMCCERPHGVLRCKWTVRGVGRLCVGRSDQHMCEAVRRVGWLCASAILTSTRARQCREWGGCVRRPF
eukprot:361080-Chlamydomonas_euryale.AAC.1